LECRFLRKEGDQEKAKKRPSAQKKRKKKVNSTTTPADLGSWAEKSRELKVEKLVRSYSPKIGGDVQSRGPRWEEGGAHPFLDLVEKGLSQGRPEKSSSVA